MKTKICLWLLLFCFVLEAQNLVSSNLPIVIINTDTNESGIPQEIQDEVRIGANMKIIYHTDGTRNYLTDQTNANYLNYNGRISIEIRGSTSQWLDKKPYGLTTLQADNTSNNNVSLLDMPEENDWILNALAFDNSLIRDVLSYDLARSIGEYAPRVQFCEVMINGTYQGLYLLSEKIKIDSKRVNIIKLTNTDNTQPNISGGYITKCDKTTGGDPVAWEFTTNIGNTVAFIHDAPNPSEITNVQNNYIYNRFTALEQAAAAQNASVSNGYPSIIDVPTFVDFMLINELASNVDAYQLSTYFHKDRNGKLRAGPIWDFNLAYGLDVFGNRSLTNVWQFDNVDNVGAKFWKNLYNNSVFNCYLRKRWAELTAANAPLNYNTLISKINSYTTLLAEARARENTRWGTLTNYAGNIINLKSWLQTRINWLNGHWGSTVNCTFPTLPNIVISKINYNPVEINGNTSNNLEFIELTNNSAQTVNVSGYYFKELGLTYIFPNNATLAPNGKIYLASNSTAFTSVYGFAPYGTFTRNLSNKSQALVLADAFGNIVDSVTYLDNTPWPAEADGNGSYLSLIDLNADNALAESWTASSATLSASEFASENATQVYPNPTTATLYIYHPKIRIKTYELIDVLGRSIVSQNLLMKNEITIDLSALAAQQYFLKLVFEDGSSVVKKILKQ
ncbi:CotH kinase family protein [Flavobacterium sp. CYK-55]|uniref:CotH kinase family protein n=1 Tax=Flavobacterium sp. CYK-55 TaxID=2835529 RepID=UPI001BCFF2E0|nr:CotH kinase family protein [Flavobacterium sp. CYK-55]MBS7786579.1 CotH kinase family protein [Flavobacterium sp. CYK-55]